METGAEVPQGPPLLVEKCAAYILHSAERMSSVSTPGVQRLLGRGFFHSRVFTAERDRKSSCCDAASFQSASGFTLVFTADDNG